MKVKAFTILETIITLVVSSLIIAFVYQIYSTVSLQFKQYEGLQNEAINFDQFNTVFTRDVNLCQYIEHVTDHTVRLKFSKKSITYHFENTYTIRHGEHKDTFNVKVHATEWQPWSGNTQRATETLTLKTIVSDRHIDIFEHKPIDIATRINNQFAE